MTVPASVKQMLDSGNVAYQLLAHHGRFAPMRSPLETSLRDTVIVKALLLQDSDGLVQVLLPNDHMLDLAQFNMQLKRILKPVGRPQLFVFLENAGVKQVPGIPFWQGLKTFVDNALMRQANLWLESGDGEQMLEILQNDFRGMIQNATLGDFAVPIPRVPDSDEMDPEQIHHSVKTFTQRRISQRLEETLDLPPLPETAQRIIQLRGNPDADISDLAEIIELDPSLAAQVVSWASSPFYSAPGKVRSVQDAIMRVLGFDMVFNLALGLSLGRRFNSKVISAEHIKHYWQSAVCMAATIEGLVTSMPREQRPSFGLAYLSGLLNDFGYLILADVFPPQFEQISQHCDINEHLPCASIEQHWIGVSSCQITARLFDLWHMPPEIVSAIRHQHNPHYAGEHHKYAQLIFLARQLMAQNGFGRMAQPIPEKIYDDLCLSSVDAQVVVKNIMESANDLKAIAAKLQG